MTPPAMTPAPCASGERVAIRTPARFRLTPPVVREHPIQKQLCDARLEIAPPGKVSRDGVVWWAVDHANYAGEAPGIRVGRGIIAGLPDLFILYRGRAHHPEIKAADGALSRPSRASALRCLPLAAGWPWCAMLTSCWLQSTSGASRAIAA